ncbi:MAG: MBL fold metallo-hydrolase [Deltaproteobacteria bacterium]|nr:MBL fold metallo-hydrolase [Deltaproteobacteria bacterium]MBW2050975.1 MBL fold metallo-hydrolase [Deltaproteobacteria bacterium]MBW2141862.1 MBL fold metallo-hydrolase [Deltaproteobacteria bacterium]MBW2324657.1 MBL fold metallo-hydrolase [Deltaproteobacteria bacterium]
MKIFDGLYFYPWESYSQNNCNSLMITGKVNTLIDPGHQALFPQLAKQLESDGIDYKELDLAINTHSHPDHFEASVSLASYNVPIAMHPAGEDYLKKIGPAFSQALGHKMPEYHIDLYLVEGELELGETRLQVYHTPGHSPGSICLYWPERKVLISGDLIFSQGVGRTDFPGGSGTLLKESIERMAELEIEVLLPGHGPAVFGAQDVKRNFQFIKQMYFQML